MDSIFDENGRVRKIGREDLTDEERESLTAQVAGLAAAIPAVEKMGDDAIELTVLIDYLVASERQRCANVVREFSDVEIATGERVLLASKILDGPKG